jgi:hypothetical protein
MSIDWSKAPDWAIAHALHAFGGEISEVWVGEEQYQRLDQTKPFPYGGGAVSAFHNPRRYQFRYETLRPAPWTGEGLPPVGTVCEWHGPNSDGPNGWVYTASRVVAYTEDHLFVCMQAPSCWPVVQRIDNCEFRPIRTPEQIAAEEIETIFKWMVNRDSERGLRGIAEDLHADGYRKQVKP